MKPRPVAHALRANVRKEIDELLKLGVIRHSRSPWACAIVLVDKPDATKRLCMDYRPLNLIAEPTAYPLPRIKDIFACLRGARYFTSLDISKGFWQLNTHPDDCMKTAFVTSDGLHEWTRLPMGLNSSPGAFQEVMTQVLGELIWTVCLIYIDDILIYTSNFQHHLSGLEDVLQRLIANELKLRPSKCESARTEL